MGIKVFLYTLPPIMLIKTKSQIRKREIVSLTDPTSKKSEIFINPRLKKTSRINGTIMYEITPITIDKPNH